mgnify:CR=1 FL=1
MNREELCSLLKEYPVIAAVKDEKGLDACLFTECRVVFILYGNVMNICDIVKRVKNAGKTAFVHIDLIEGLSAKEVAVEYIVRNTGADGIISTKQALIKSASAHGLLTVQRFFMLDSLAIDTLKKQIKGECMDVIEILPGCIPKIISKIVQITDLPVIASGLLQDKEDIKEALSSGAAAVSGTKFGLWQ